MPTENLKICLLAFLCCIANSSIYQKYYDEAYSIAAAMTI